MINVFSQHKAASSDKHNHCIFFNDGHVRLHCEQICFDVNRITYGFLMTILYSPHVLIRQLFVNLHHWPTTQAFVLLVGSTFLLEYNWGLQSLALSLSQICFHLFFFSQTKKKFRQKADDRTRFIVCQMTLWHHQNLHAINLSTILTVCGFSFLPSMHYMLPF